jgi:hypothetical protein
MESAHLQRRDEELRAEQRLLLKADLDIEKGRNRLRDQQELMGSLRDAGKDTRQAERLVHVFSRILVEWERHRVLIAQRIAYLEKEVANASHC